MGFGELWLDNSVSIKLPKLETGSSPVPGFGTKQVIAIQQPLSIELLVVLWGKLLCLLLHTPGAMHICFFGEWVHVPFGKL